MMPVRKVDRPHAPRVALLTAGKDQPYALGLLNALQGKPVHVEFIGNDAIAGSDIVRASCVDFYNLVGNQDARASRREKVLRVLTYYIRLIIYAARTEAKLLHILWFRKFPSFEKRILPNTYFKMLRKKSSSRLITLMIKPGMGKSALINKLSLRFLYHIVDHILRYTPKMKRQLIEAWGIAEDKITVVPHGINDVTPVSQATRLDAKQQLGFGRNEKILLFFGNMARQRARGPYSSPGSSD